MPRLSLIPMLALLALAPLTRADDAAADKVAPKPPLTATLTSNKDAYPLDPAQSGEDFRKTLAAKGRKPAPSKVDLTFTITNNSDKEIKLEIGGDSSRFNFKLEGPGAVTVENMIPMTREFRSGEPITLAPGKTHDFKLASLAGGMRGVSEYSYFTEPGDYKLSATLTYNAGEKQFHLTSDTITIKVTK